ncbi:DUF4232 domain-containing protein [Streptomyces sp. NPDC001156]
MKISGGRVLAAAVLFGALVGCAAEPAYESEPAGTPVHAASALPSPSTPPPSPSPRRSPPPLPSRSAEAKPTHVAAAPTVRQAPPPAAVPRCRSTDLVATAGSPGPQPGGHADDQVIEVVLRNGSNGTCSLQGWAGLAVFGDGLPVACNPDCGQGPDTTEPRSVAVTRAPGLTPEPVVLAPGNETTYGLLWSYELGPECELGDRGWDPPYGARIWVPDDSRPLTIAPLAQMWACGGRIQLTPIGQPFLPSGGAAGGVG